MKLIIIVGKRATGKSTFAEFLFDLSDNKILRIDDPLQTLASFLNYETKYKHKIIIIDDPKYINKDLYEYLKQKADKIFRIEMKGLS